MGGGDRPPPPPTTFLFSQGFPVFVWSKFSLGLSAPKEFSLGKGYGDWGGLTPCPPLTSWWGLTPLPLWGFPYSPTTPFVVGHETQPDQQTWILSQHPGFPRQTMSTYWIRSEVFEQGAIPIPLPQSFSLPSLMKVCACGRACASLPC